jgi:Uncharacterized protein conserved in bacteria (DUF2064)
MTAPGVRGRAADGGDPTSGAPRVLVMAGNPELALAHPDLEPLLGRERCVELERMLVDRAVAWAEAVAPGSVQVDRWPPGPEAVAPGSVQVGRWPPGPEGATATDSQAPVRGEGARMAVAASRLFVGAEGPLLIAWPDLPRWRPDAAAAALDDFADGCDASFGPVFDGGLYLVALARELPELLAAADEAWRGPEAMTTALGASHLGGLRAGLLRAERGLRRPGDVDAALADPLLDDELAAFLRG